MTVESKAPASDAGPPPSNGPTGRRAAIAAKTLRTDRWWLQPAITFGILFSFVIYSTWAAFIDRDYFSEPYISPFYSPCLSTKCGTVPGSAGVPHIGLFGDIRFISPAIFILIVPLGFRMTCYYYRKAYYRAFWLSPPACAVAEPHKKYTGETRFPLMLQNVHRYFFYLGFLLNIILTYDAVIAFRNHHGQWGHAGLGTLVLLLNAVFFGRTPCRATRAAASWAAGSTTFPSTPCATGSGAKSPSTTATTCKSPGFRLCGWHFPTSTCGSLPPARSPT